MIGTSSSNAYTDTNVAEGSTYVYEVSAVDNENNETAKSNSVTFFVEPKTNGGGSDGGSDNPNKGPKDDNPNKGPKK